MKLKVHDLMQKFINQSIRR